MNDQKVKTLKHKIKIIESYAIQHIVGVKPWELRKNDRDYKVGDTIEFEIVDAHNKPIGRNYTKLIVYILHGGIYGLQDGFCIMTLK